jgi:hypothetical protein
MFDCEKNVKNLFRNISERLLEEGFVILTIPDSAVIVKKLKE